MARGEPRALNRWTWPNAWRLAWQGLEANAEQAGLGLDDRIPAGTVHLLDRYARC